MNNITSQPSPASEATRTTAAKALVRMIFVWAMLLGIAASGSPQTNKFERYYQLVEKIAPYRESLRSASVLYDKDRWYAQSYMEPSTPEDVKKFLADLAAIESIMSSGYGDVEAPRPYLENDIMQHPSEWLTLAKARNEIIAKIKGAADADKATAEVKFLKEIIAKIKANDGWGLTENGLKIVLGKREEARQKLCGGNKYPGWDDACDELTTTARSLAPKNRSYAKYQNSTAADVIKKGWAKNYPDRKIVSILAAKSDWTIVHDSLGRPKYRSVGMAVRYKLAGFDLVVEQSISILQDYVGGTYKYRPTAQSSDYRIVK